MHASHIFDNKRHKFHLSEKIWKNSPSTEIERVFFHRNYYFFLRWKYACFSKQWFALAFSLACCACETGMLLGVTQKTVNNILCRFHWHGDVIMSALTREQALLPIEYFLHHPSAYLKFRVHFFWQNPNRDERIFFTKIQKRIVNPKNLVHFEWILQFKSESRFLSFVIQTFILFFGKVSNSVVQCTSDKRSSMQIYFLAIFFVFVSTLFAFHSSRILGQY